MRSCQRRLVFLFARSEYQLGGRYWGVGSSINKAHINNKINAGFIAGAGSRNRTGTISQSADFESAASTNFATPAGVELRHRRDVLSPELWHITAHEF